MSRENCNQRSTSTLLFGTSKGFVRVCVSSKNGFGLQFRHFEIAQREHDLNNSVPFHCAERKRYITEFFRDGIGDG